MDIRGTLKTSVIKLDKVRDYRNGEDVDKSIRHEDCVQDIPPCFADIEVWLLDYPLPKKIFIFLTIKN